MSVGAANIEWAAGDQKATETSRAPDYVISHIPRVPPWHWPNSDQLPLALGADVVHVWCCHFDTFGAQEVRRCVSNLNASDRARLERIPSETVRLHFLVGRALATHALSHYLRQPPHTIQFSIGPEGRPEIAWAKTHQPVHFNISHTAGFAAVAVGRRPALGIDVETMERDIDVEEVAQLVFTDFEVEHILRRAALRDDRELLRKRFFELWTLKEAYIKARGLGFGLSPKSFEFSGVEDCINLQRAPACDPHPAKWQFRLFGRRNGVQMAIAAGNTTSLTIRHFEWKPG